MGFFFFSSRSSSLFLFLLLLCGRAHAQVVINEIYYDHPGSDDGYEFIEIYNGSAVVVTVADLSLEFHNGSGEGWSEIWRGSVAGVIRPDEVFVVGGALVRPAPDAVLDTGLQNGPDALRLVNAGAVVDVAGYGGLDDPAYVETLGAAKVSSGESVGRMPDGRDTNDNASDFSAMVPSPGGYNRARVDAALEFVSPAHDVRAVPGNERLRVAVRNGGLDTIEPGSARVVFVDSTETGAAPAGEAWNDDAIDAATSGAVELSVDAGYGYHWFVATLDLPGDERAYNNAIIFARRVGTIDLVVSEVLSDPPGDAPQFVELFNAGGEPYDLSGYFLRDKSHASETVTSSPHVIAPGGFVVITPDSAALAAAFVLPPGVVTFEGTWPSINRSGDGDSVVVLDAHRLTVEAVAVPPMPTDSDGRSLERVDLFAGSGGAVWVVSDDPSGATPGRAGARSLLRAAPSGTITVSPNPFVPSRGDHLLVSMMPAPGVARVVVTAFDTSGRAVADLGSASAFPAVIAWNGIDRSGRIVLPGLYVVAVEQFESGGTRAGVEKVVVGCAASGD